VVDMLLRVGMILGWDWGCCVVVIVMLLGGVKGGTNK
jgi:hypothetical protein